MKMKFILSILTLALFVSCDPKPVGNTSSETNPVNIGGGGGNQGGGGNGGGSGSSCLGNENDGQGPGYPIYHMSLLLSGGKSWVPGDYSYEEPAIENLARQTMFSIPEARGFFNTDARLRLRFKVHSQPSPSDGDKYCYNRNTGITSDPYDYTKLKFKIYLRDVLCTQVDPNDSSQCNQYELGARYRERVVGPINVDDCSPVIDFPSNTRNTTQWGTVVEVAYVYADSACQYGASNSCPAEIAVRTSSCWNMTMQIVTDHTQDFK